MNEIDKIAEEVFGDPDGRGKFYQYTKKDVRDKSYREHVDGDPMTIDQWERVMESDDIHSSEPNGWRGRDAAMHDDLRKIEDAWPNVEVRIGGELDERHSYAETVWVHYDDVRWWSDFEQWMVLRFRSTMRDPMKNVCPMCDDRVYLTNECFRYPNDDPTLLATTDEFGFRENDEWGKYVRMWWDD